MSGKINPQNLLAALLAVVLLCAAPQGTRAEEPDAETYQLATQLVAVQTNPELRNRAGDTLTLMLTPLILRDNPGQQDEVQKLMQNSFAPVMGGGYDEILRHTAMLYAQNFSPDELRDLIAFQESPVGVKSRKFNLDLLPKITEFSKTTITNKTLEATRALAAALRSNNLHVPKELGAQ